MATNVTVKGVECVANLTGKGALSLATFLIAALKDQKRTKGKARMRAFDGKPTKVFVIKAKGEYLQFLSEYVILQTRINPCSWVDLMGNIAMGLIKFLSFKHVCVGGGHVNRF